MNAPRRKSEMKYLAVCNGRLDYGENEEHAMMLAKQMLREEGGIYVIVYKPIAMLAPSPEVITTPFPE